MDQVRQLSDKLGEILGDSAEPGDGARRNAKGEVRPLYFSALQQFNDHMLAGQRGRAAYHRHQ